MNKINRKGFTLVELLSVIVILGLITGITITVVLTMITNAKAKSQELTKQNIKDTAEKYIYEGFTDNTWKKIDSEEDSENEYKCVKVQDLIDAGYYKQNIIEKNSDISPNNIIKIIRNVSTKTIVSKGIVDYDIDCLADTATPFITCGYNKEYAREKDVTIKYLHSENYEKRIYPNDISEYELLSGISPTQINDYYISNNEEVHLLAKDNGIIIANTISNGNQMASLYCNVEKIDRIAPIVKLTVENGNDLSCKITDKESGVKEYKLCKKGTENCSENSAGYTEFESNPITENGVDNGMWFCIGKDKAGNTAKATAVVQNAPVASINATFIAKVGNNIYNGNWTNSNVELIGSITTNVDTSYILTDTEINNLTSATGWQTYNNNEITQTINQTTNKTYHLYIKYNDAGVTKYIDNLNQVVQIDKNPPTCVSNITTNNSLSGVSGSITCNDTGGSKCTNSNTYNFTNQTSDYSIAISDKAGNTKNCKIEVTQMRKKKYCNDNKYNERCVTNPNQFTSTNYNNTTCSGSYSKHKATQVFRYYVRQTRTQWWNTTNQTGNLNNYSSKLCYSSLVPTSWDAIKHEPGDDKNKYFWYAIGPLSSGSSIDSPVKRGIKGYVICGNDVSDSKPPFPNLGNGPSYTFPTNYFNRYSSVPSSIGQGKGIDHRGYMCVYTNEVTNENCPVNDTGKLIIPLKNGGYYVEPKMGNGNPKPDSGPSNWNGEKWFTCVSVYHGAVVN